MVLWVVLGLLLAGMLYVRLAPIDPARWHQPVEAVQDEDRPDGAVRVLAGDAEVMRQLDRAMRAEPRTRVLAGSVQAGHITYVTRSAVFGFPDMTTLQRTGDQIRLHARLRFGASDLGVNGKRLERVIAILQ